MKYILCALFVFSTSLFCQANEKENSSSKTLKSSSVIAVVIKIAGRINCNSIAELQLEENCFGDFISKDIQRFNNKVSNEDLLAIKVLRGDLKPRDIISIGYTDIGDYRGLRFGVPYLVFFHEKNKQLYYEPCDVIEYALISKEVSANPELDKLIDKISGMPVFNCPKIKMSFPQ